MATEVKVPTLGESVTEATIGEWLKQPGEPVKVDEPIASLETDKVAVEVPAPVAGVMGEQAVKVGDTVEVGAVIATIEDAMAAGEQPRSRRAKRPSRRAGKPPPARHRRRRGRDRRGASDPATLSPAVRRAVLEHGVDPTRSRAPARTAG